MSAEPMQSFARHMGRARGRSMQVEMVQEDEQLPMRMDDDAEVASPASFRTWSRMFAPTTLLAAMALGATIIVAGWSPSWTGFHKGSIHDELADEEAKSSDGRRSTMRLWQWRVDGSFRVSAGALPARREVDGAFLEFHYHCVDKGGSMLHTTENATGHGNLLQCKALCLDSDRCAAVEWVAKHWCRLALGHQVVDHGDAEFSDTACFAKKVTTTTRAVASATTASTLTSMGSAEKVATTARAVASTTTDATLTSTASTSPTTTVPATTATAEAATGTSTMFTLVFPAPATESNVAGVTPYHLDLIT